MIKDMFCPRKAVLRPLCERLSDLMSQLKSNALLVLCVVCIDLIVSSKNEKFVRTKNLVFIYLLVG